MLKAGIVFHIPLSNKTTLSENNERSLNCNFIRIISENPHHNTFLKQLNESRLIYLFICICFLNKSHERRKIIASCV